MCVHACVRVHVGVCMHACVHTCMHVCVCVCAPTPIHTHTHLQKQAAPADSRSNAPPPTVVAALRVRGEERMHTATGAEDAAWHRLTCRSPCARALPLPLVPTALRCVRSLLRARRRPAARAGWRAGGYAGAPHAPTRSPTAAHGCPHADQAGAAGGATRGGAAGNLFCRDASAATVVARACGRCRCAGCPLSALRLRHVLPPLHHVPSFSARAFACTLAEAARMPARPRRTAPPAPRARALTRACAPRVASHRSATLPSTW